VRQPISSDEATERREGEHWGGAAERERAGDCRDCHPVDQQRRCVIEQALALQDRHDAARRAELAEHSCSGDRIRRGHDRAQGNGSGDGKVGELPAYQRHRRCGQHDRDECQRRKRQRIPL
jgi:hypothetical protein